MKRIDESQTDRGVLSHGLAITAFHRLHMKMSLLTRMETDQRHRVALKPILINERQVSESNSVGLCQVFTDQLRCKDRIYVIVVELILVGDNLTVVSTSDETVVKRCRRERSSRHDSNRIRRA